MKETTILIGPKIKIKLDEAANILGSSRSMLIVMLLKKIMDDAGLFLRGDRLVEYQACEPGNERRRLHIRIDMKEYECFLDLRKFCKKSVSLLVALAVDLFLDKIIDELSHKNKNTDNYLIHSYILIQTRMDNTISWIIYWGIPNRINYQYRN